MDSVDYYKLKISPIDAAIEWFIKGMNIGLVYGYCFKEEVMRIPDRRLYRVNVTKYIMKNSLYTGLILSTWWFFNKTFERIIEKDLWINYSISGAIVLVLWRKQLDITQANLKKFFIPTMIFTGFLGKLITDDQ